MDERADVSPEIRERLQRMVDSGQASWSGLRFVPDPNPPRATVRGSKTLAELLSEDRGLSPSAMMEPMRTYMAVIERCPETGLYVGYVPGFPGAHSQGATLDELHANLREVIEMLLEDGEPKLEAEFIGTQRITVG
jgi:predicted RNase H-like HicB family nuclease